MHYIYLYSTWTVFYTVTVKYCSWKSLTGMGSKVILHLCPMYPAPPPATLRTSKFLYRSPEQIFKVSPSNRQWYKEKKGHDYDNEEINRIKFHPPKIYGNKKKDTEKWLVKHLTLYPQLWQKNPIIPLLLIGYLQPQPVGAVFGSLQTPKVFRFGSPGSPNRQHQLVARSLVENTGGVFIFTNPPQKKKQNMEKKLKKKNKHQAPEKNSLKSPHLFVFFCSPFFSLLENVMFPTACTINCFGVGGLGDISTTRGCTLKKHLPNAPKI